MFEVTGPLINEIEEAMESTIVSASQPPVGKLKLHSQDVALFIVIIQTKAWQVGIANDGF